MAFCNIGDVRVVVSVIIPAYNAAGWLADTLASARGQTLKDIEILVIDDGSSDGTATLVRDQMSEDGRIRLIERPNGGVGAARNSGIREARGRYIAPLDADDLWYPRKLELQVARMEACGEDVGLVYCRSEKIDAQGRIITAAFATELEGWVSRSLILRNFIGNASVPLFRASALEQIGLYLERAEQGGAQGCEDWDLSIRIAERFRVGLVREALVSYRQIGDCMSLNVAAMGESYRITMDRARARNPALESSIFRWSAGNFHSYLVAKCHLWGDYPACLRSMLRAVLEDPILLSSLKFHLMAGKSLIRLLTGTRGQAPWSGIVDAPPQPKQRKPRPRRQAWADAIKRKRMQALLDQDKSYRPPDSPPFA